MREANAQESWVITSTATTNDNSLDSNQVNGSVYRARGCVKYSQLLCSLEWSYYNSMVVVGLRQKEMRTVFVMLYLSSDLHMSSHQSSIDGPGTPLSDELIKTTST